MSTTHLIRRARPAAVAAALSAVCLFGTAAVARAADCVQQGLYESCTYSYTGDEQTFAVPDGVHRLGVMAIGGSGGISNDGSARGGRGAQVSSTVDVPAGRSTLYVEVGGNGAAGTSPLSFTRAPGGFNKGGVGGEGNPYMSFGGGGGGGGESDVRTCSEHGSGEGCQGDPRLVIAGGGGGGGGGAQLPGGLAGIDSAGDGQDGGGPDAGAGGTATAGGAGGDAGAAGGGQDGSLVLGGDGADGGGGGGGGGAGFFGGGGGAAGTLHGASGGAGSSFGPPGTTFSVAGVGVQPMIVITYPIDTTPPAISLLSPGDGATYSQNEVVDAFYSCADPGGSGVTSCTGPVGFGQPIDTSQVGSHTFTVTSTDATGNQSTESATYTVQAPGPPVQAAAPPVQPPAGNPVSPVATVANLVLPAIKGTPRVGRRLTAAPGTWSGAGPISIRYQWERCNSGGRHCAPIARATRQAYTPTRADRGHRLTVVITATDAAAHAAKATARSVGPIVANRRTARP
ncbi:MAG TPA: glycine-rich protein [Solirubrobacteraceae bacterium]|nr:glycine-rich protein [Solirubrobacteraceae bacterium]